MLKEKISFKVVLIFFLYDYMMMMMMMMIREGGLIWAVAYERQLKKLKNYNKKTTENCHFKQYWFPIDKEQ